MCFVHNLRIAIILLCNINCLSSIKETVCIYLAVRPESMYIIRDPFNFYMVHKDTYLVLAEVTPDVGNDPTCL